MHHRAPHPPPPPFTVRIPRSPGAIKHTRWVMPLVANITINNDGQEIVLEERCAVPGGHAGPVSGAADAGRPENCFAGGDGMGARRRRGGGVPEMGFRAGPFVLCKDGCCHQRRWNTNFGPENFFQEKNFPHICVVKIISATWGSF